MPINISDIPVYVMPKLSTIFSSKRTKYKYFNHIHYLDIDYQYDHTINEKLNDTKIYLDCLRHLIQNISCPFILLENKAVMFSDYDYEVSYPNDADAVYLGIMNNGFDNILADYNKSNGADTILAKYIDEYNIYRIYNMLGMYAILYNSLEYVERAIYAMQYMLNLQLHGSRGLASIMKYYKVYALNQSIFYHKVIPEFTKFNITDCDIRDIFY